MLWKCEEIWMTFLLVISLWNYLEKLNTLYVFMHIYIDMYIYIDVYMSIILPYILPYNIN